MRIILVDDHAVVRAGYRSLLSEQPDIELVAEFAHDDEAYRCLRDIEVDVVVMDLHMPGGSSLDTLRRMHQRSTRLRSLIFSMYASASFATQAFAAGASGYVTKSSEASVLPRALREVHAGNRFLSADIAQEIATTRFGHERGALEHLTVREFEVLRLLLSGQSVADIANILSLSEKTIRNLHYSVKRKLEVRDDIELVRLAVRLDVVDLLEFATESG